MLLRVEILGRFALAALLVASACSDEPTAPAGDPTTKGDPSTETEGDDRDAGRKKPSATPDASSGKGDKPTASQDAGRTPSVSDADAGKALPGAGAGEGIPCDVAKIIGEKCSLCHQDPPQFGAPFALTELAHFAAPASDKAKKVHETALARVTATTKKMPPTTSPQLTADELKKLTAWLQSGAKASSDTCAVPVQTDKEGEAQPAGAGGSGSASVKPIDYQDPELECFKFTAYEAGKRAMPYQVPTSPDYYVLFTMKAPWEGDRYIRSFKSITDNKAVIHHWILFSDRANNPESVVGPASGTHSNSERLFGWAPGGDDLYYDPDVGMKASGGVSYSLETHYNNGTGSRAPDASGVEVCVTKKAPKYEVTQAWVGTDSISGTSATGTCKPSNKEPVKILASHPHMHKTGKNMKVIVNRAGGMKETVFDKPFDFDYQKVELVDITIMPGDTITTICDYSAPARFGKGTNDEMCYFFPVSYPPHGLVMNNLYSTLHGPDTCIP